MKRFSSKIGLELAVPLTVLLGGMLIWLAYDQEWVDTAILAVIIAFVVHPFLTTYYQIEGDTLRVKCGFLINKSVRIQSIRRITETRNSAGAPAVSLDRLELVYNSAEVVLVSPKEKKQFIDELLKIKPDIEVRLKS